MSTEEFIHLLENIEEDVRVTRDKQIINKENEVINQLNKKSKKNG